MFASWGLHGVTEGFRMFRSWGLGFRFFFVFSRSGMSESRTKEYEGPLMIGMRFP